MRPILIALLLAMAVPAHAKSWWATTCERLLGAKRTQISERLRLVANSLQTQIHFNNRFTAFPQGSDFESLDFLSHESISVVVRPTLGHEFEWVRQPRLEVFANPHTLGLNWEDQGDGICGQYAFLMLLEDVEVQVTPERRMRLSDLLIEEVQIIRRRNPRLNFELKWSRAEEFAALPISPAHSDKLVVWTEGDIENFQAKRILLVVMDHVFTALTRDPAFVRVKAPRH
ncbi:MAG: hypothetical protein KF799_02125 [Bdellovibrionales bacterium]|nr:hypothetical protein [Bdellovibrionales bacterium]